MRLRAAHFVATCSQPGQLFTSVSADRKGLAADPDPKARDAPEKSQTFSTIFFLSRSLMVQSRTSTVVPAIRLEEEACCERLSFISLRTRLLFPLPAFPTTMSFIR